MTPMHEARTAPPSTVQRKQLLIAEGAACRARIGCAAHELQAGLHAQSMVKSAFLHAATIGWRALANRHSTTGTGIQAVFPLLVSGISILSGKSWLRRFSGAALTLTVVGAVAGIMADRRARQTARGT